MSTVACSGLKVSSRLRWGLLARMRSMAFLAAARSPSGVVGFLARARRRLRVFSSDIRAACGVEGGEDAALFLVLAELVGDGAALGGEAHHATGEGGDFE